MPRVALSWLGLSLVIMCDLNSFVDLCYCKIDLISYIGILDCLPGTPCGCAMSLLLNFSHFIQWAQCLWQKSHTEQPYWAGSAKPGTGSLRTLTFATKRRCSFFFSGCKTACSHRGKHTLKLCHLGSQIPFLSTVTWRSTLSFSCCPLSDVLAAPAGSTGPLNAS